MRLLSLSLLLALTACGVSPNSSSTSADATSAPVDEALASQVTGTYAALVEMHSIQPVPLTLQFIAGKEIKVTGRIYQLVNISMQNGALQVTEKNCSLVADKVAGASINIPDSSIQKTPALSSKLELAEVDGTLSIKRGSRTVVVGANLANPLTDALPETSSDPRLVDVDSDGKPGLTSRLSFGFLKGDIHFIQRSTTDYEAVLGADGELSGIINDKTEQVTLGGTGIAAGLAATKGPVLTVQDPNVPSTVRFVKIKDGSDCSTASNTKLFQ